MPGPPHIVRAPAVVGLNEAVRHDLVDFGTNNLRAENVRQFNTGEAGTRFGFTALSNAHIDATTPTAGYKLFADHRSPVRICDGQIEAYSSKAQAWKALGRVPECGISLTPVPSIDSPSYFEDIESTNGYLALSWIKINVAAGTTSSWLSIVDQATGAVLRAPEQISTSTAAAQMQLTTIGNSFIAVRYNATGTKIEGWALDTTSAATINTGWVAFASPLCTDASGAVESIVVHPVPSVATPRFALLYVNTSVGASRLTLKTFDVTGTLVAGQTVNINTSSVTPAAVAMAGNPTDTLWTMWNEGASIKACGFTPTSIATAPPAATAIIMTMALSTDTMGIAASSVVGKARMWANDTNATPRGQMCGVTISGGLASPDGPQVTIPAASLRRKPFFYNGRYYGVFAGAEVNNSQQNMILCDWTNNDTFIRPIGNPAPGIATAGFFTQGRIVAGSTAGQFYFGITIQRSGVASGSTIVLADFNDTRRWQPCAWGNSTYLSGGLASCFDGTRVAEVGFLIRPPQPTTTLSGTGLTGAYRYVCVYEEVDADGNWHQSGLSTPSASVSPVNQSITVQTQPLTITSRMAAGSGTDGGAVRVAFYRTLAGAVAPYYRVAVVPNDTSTSIAFYVDNTSDATLATKAKLYEQPGVLNTSQDKRPPPSFQCVVSYNGMLVGASGSDVWYSGQNVSGEGVWFSPIFQIPVPGDGDIIGMWALDGTLFVAKRREIYAITGEAPSDNGASGGLGLPRRLAVDLGCIESRSVCVTAFGAIFQSERGIELLSRAQTVTWIGQPIQDTLAAFPVVTSATVVPSSFGAEVLIELAASQAAGLVAGSGRTLVFDLSANAWISTDRRTSSTGTVDAPAQSACITYTGSAYRYAWMTAAGVVHYEDPTTYLDANGTFVVPLIETGWFNAFQNEQRVWRLSLLFQRYTAAGLKVEVAYNYGDYDPLDNAVWTEVDTKGQRQLEMSPSPRGESMKFRITTTAPAVLGSGQGLSVFALALDLAAKQGPTKGTVRLDPALRR